MTRREIRASRLSRELEGLEEEIRLIEEELSYHRHLADDAARDAAVYDDPIERENARMTAADVDRFERQLGKLERRRVRLEAKRDKLGGGP